MKIRILDRILVALAGVLVLAGCAALAAQLFFQKDIAGFAQKLLQDEQYRAWLIAALVLLVILGCYCLLMLFRHRGRSDKFVLQKTENGELCISLKALESMVQKCLDPHKELSVQDVRLENQKGGLLIRIRGNVAGNVSIPLTVDALQQQIKQYVTACSGVEVKDIRVMIESSGPDSQDSLFAIEPPAARALPGGEKEDKAAETVKEKEDSSGLSAEELEQVMAEMPAPRPAEAEETAGKAETVTVSAAAAAAAEMLRNEAPQEDDDRPIHQRLFSSPEEPCVMPMPPEKAEGKAAEEAAKEPEPKAENEDAAAKEPAETGMETAEPKEEKAEAEKETNDPVKDETENGTSEGSKEA